MDIAIHPLYNWDQVYEGVFVDGKSCLNCSVFSDSQVTWERVSHLRQKALHALFSLRRNTDFKSLKPSLACKILDSMISPILTYNSEGWGTFVKSDFKSWDNSPIEKGHLPFCKRYLEVHNKASNMASRAELGKYSMIIEINKKILNY